MLPNNIPGTSKKKAASNNGVVAPVCSKSHNPKPTAVIRLPIIESAWVSSKV
jgi:hypothetical protein